MLIPGLAGLLPVTARCLFAKSMGDAVVDRPRQKKIARLVLSGLVSRGFI
ncbi:MAG TPA: hypothetical protein VHX86_07935 [Tepidisphaeraceae bacterium]|jgi:hypothetical protein|nr:hypothetical protein [Tepidisphaeraceae bacterium]